MSYYRVIPRDLFNEANLLKCYGQLWLKLDDLNLPDVVLDHFDNEMAPFNIEQIPSSGATYLSNVVLMVKGTQVYLERLLNSRFSWPLLAYTQNLNGYTDPIPVFSEETGNLSQAFLDLITAEPK